MIGSPKRWDRGAALTSTLHWFETELLTREENLVGLMAVNRELIGQAETLDHADRVVLDMDSRDWACWRTTSGTCGGDSCCRCESRPRRSPVSSSGSSRRVGGWSSTPGTSG